MRIAAVDVGSNSIHMVVAEVEADGRFNVLDRAKDMVGLGAGTLSKGKLSNRAIETGIETLAKFRTLAERQGATRVAAVATSAVREAANGGDFIRRVKQEVGWRIRIIQGLEEARLIYMGVRHAFDLADQPTLIIDIGGGSVELILVDDDQPVWMESFKLGVARLTDTFLAKDPPSAKELAALDDHIADELAPLGKALKDHPVERVIGTSGSMLNLISMAGHTAGNPPTEGVHNFAVSASTLSKVRRAVCKADREARGKMKGLDAKRVDLILAGAMVADRIVKRSGVDEVVGCTWALREGVLLDFIARHRHGIKETVSYDNARARSVVRLARHFGETGGHGKQVARLALSLFDQLADVIELEPEAREWLEYAALLHDVGHHIAHKNHHRHSYYLVKNGELLGFSADEIEIIGLLARYHRKATPKDGDTDFSSLTRSQRETVRALSAILRVADSLDRSHFGLIRDVSVSLRDDRMTLSLRTGGADAALELWEAEQRAKPLAQLLDVDVVFRVLH